MAATMAAFLLAGAFIWYKPFLERDSQPPASIPAPPPMFVVAPFPVPAHREACMRSVTLDPNGRVATFQLRPAKPLPAGGPPVDLVLSAPGYKAVASVPGGYPGGGVSVPVTPPRRPEIGTACFVNRGTTSVVFTGTTEARTIARPTTTVAGRPVPGDIALSFFDSRSRSLLSRLDEVFSHASALTDRLVPTWLIWGIAICAALGMPAMVIVAFCRSLSESWSA
ncbi:MAG: hypothetical protein ACTHM1_03320 [Solirubrobacteraceae bacterium]